MEFNAPVGCEGKFEFAHKGVFKYGTYPVGRITWCYTMRERGPIVSSLVPSDPVKCDA